jgi:hypothetical protein
MGHHQARQGHPRRRPTASLTGARLARLAVDLLGMVSHFLPGDPAFGLEGERIQSWFRPAWPIVPDLSRSGPVNSDTRFWVQVRGGEVIETAVAAVDMLKTVAWLWFPRGWCGDAGTSLVTESPHRFGRRSPSLSSGPCHHPVSDQSPSRRRCDGGAAQPRNSDSKTRSLRRVWYSRWVSCSMVCHRLPCCSFM